MIQHIHIESGLVSDTDTDIQPANHYQILSMRLRHARLAWMNAKYMITLANRGECSKSQAFTLLNRVRKEYKATITFTEACLGISRAARVVEQASQDYIDTVNMHNVRVS